MKYRFTVFIGVQVYSVKNRVNSKEKLSTRVLGLLDLDLQKVSS